MMSDQNPHPGDTRHSQVPVGCKQWFHYWVCVGLKGTETFLKRRHLEWKCPFMSN